MLIRSLISASLLYSNTYYPLKKITNIDIKTNLIEYDRCYSLNKIINIDIKSNLITYDRCLFINNSCSYPIKDIYPDLSKFNNLFIDDINIGLDVAINKLIQLNNTTNYKVSKIHSNTVDINLNSDSLKDIKLILTPLNSNLCRVFIFNNLPNYKKTLLYYNLRFIINKIIY
jgi:hypothetical protein|tara:strand:+ start:360 stop:875 length:516 start_codon:yes stop_codon:yes gene_type:complete